MEKFRGATRRERSRYLPGTVPGNYPKPDYNSSPSPRCDTCQDFSGGGTTVITRGSRLGNLLGFTGFSPRNQLGELGGYLPLLQTGLVPCDMPTYICPDGHVTRVLAGMVVLRCRHEVDADNGSPTAWDCGLPLEELPLGVGDSGRLVGFDMPTYAYECSRCRTTFEVVQRVSDPPLAVCGRPSTVDGVECECTGEVRRVIPSGRVGGFVLLGGGWAKDGY